MDFLQQVPDLQVLGAFGFALAAFQAGVGFDLEGIVVRSVPRPLFIQAGKEAGDIQACGAAVDDAAAVASSPSQRRSAHERAPTPHVRALGFC